FTLLVGRFCAVFSVCSALDPAAAPVCALSLHDALPICLQLCRLRQRRGFARCRIDQHHPVLRRHHHHRAVADEARMEWIAQEERSEEHTSELQSRENLVCRLLLEKKNGTDSDEEDV